MKRENRQTMQIAHRHISDRHQPLVIAEIGINHGGNLEVAKNMVKLAAKAGCEIIKHQTHIISDEMTSEAKHIWPPNADISIWHVMENCALSQDNEIALKAYTESLGMIYISTPFSRAAADFLHSIDVPAFKIGSGEADNLPLIRHIASFRKPIIMSTGMQTIDNLHNSVAILDAAAIPYALLECTNLYPSPPENVSLKGIIELKNAFPHAIIGFSDHSIGPEMALAAVALGANIIERHYTDSLSRQGPDIICSMDPQELKHIIKKSRHIHTALHNPKQRTKQENNVYRFARSSIVADKNLPKGHKITEKDIWARRPGTGEIAGYQFDQIIGRTLKQTVKHNRQLRWSDFINE